VSFVEAKRDLRARAIERRARAHAAGAQSAPEGARDNFAAALSLTPGAVVAGYWPVRTELDPRPLMTWLRGRGHPLALPVVAGRGRPLVFRPWRPGEELVPGELGIDTPPAAAGKCEPEILLVPLLAFDSSGHRLGHGAGYYDITIAAYRARVLAVGLAYAGQEVDAVPREPHDERLDWVVTEEMALRTGITKLR
jgi:5-formyltetrahydrofolate cyclo-ligase